MERAVILLSGGIGSAVSAWVARQEHRLALLFADYGQRAASLESAAFDRLAEALAPDKTQKIEIPYFSEFGGSARVENSLPMADARSLAETNNVADTYVPGLMLALITAAYSYARSIGAKHIVVGASENLGPPCPPTSRLHPDSRREFFQIAAHLLGPVGQTGGPLVRLHAPVIELSLPDIIQLGTHLEAPLGVTYSCFAGRIGGCSACYGCVTRAKGFAVAGLRDPARPADGRIQVATAGGGREG
jgi:7-cyano-7-deazaguanine synthase